LWTVAAAFARANELEREGLARYGFLPLYSGPSIYGVSKGLATIFGTALPETVGWQKWGLAGPLPQRRASGRVAYDEYHKGPSREDRNRTNAGNPPISHNAKPTHAPCLPVPTGRYRPVT